MQDSYREIFLAESEEYLNIMSQCLVKLEKTPSDLELLNEVFRAIHTLKGMSATMGFERLARLSHKMEDLLDGLRNQKLKVEARIVDTLFGCLDVLQALIEEIRLKKKSRLDINSCLEDLEKFLGPSTLSGPGEKVEEFAEVSFPALTITDSEVELFEAQKAKGFNIFQIKIDLVKDCALKQVRAFLIVSRLEKNMGRIIKSLPAISDLKEGKFGCSFILVLATGQKDRIIREELLTISEIEHIEINPWEPISQKGLPSRAPAPSYLKKIQGMRISAERLDKIMNLIGELTITKSRLVQIVQEQKIKPLEEAASAVERLVTALQGEIMQTRLLPVSHILDTFPRIVRDLARRQHKDIELEITGREIELDRTILDEIGDVLVHLMRNAVDHGIEPPAERRQAKKPPRAKLLIKITRQKGQICIEVADDGRGINVEAAAQTALKRGLLTKEEAARLDDEGLLKILTSPGFSTTTEVSEISGRGVGLDVVRAKMEALSGRLDFKTETGRGSRFILTLPLTLAIIKAMLVKVNNEIFAISLMNIRETIKVEEEEIKLIKSFEVIRVRDEIIPLIRLDKELEVLASSTPRDTSQAGPEEDQRLSIVIIECGTKSIGLVISRILGEQDIVVKPLGSMVKRTKGIAGATILRDGKVALILDVMNLR